MKSRPSGPEPARVAYLLRRLSFRGARLETLSRVTELTGRSYPPTKAGITAARQDLERLSHARQSNRS